MYINYSVLLESAKGHNPNMHGEYKRDTQLGSEGSLVNGYLLCRS